MRRLPRAQSCQGDSWAQGPLQLWICCVDGAWRVDFACETHSVVRAEDEEMNGAVAWKIRHYATCRSRSQALKVGMRRFRQMIGRAELP